MTEVHLRQELMLRFGFHLGGVSSLFIWYAATSTLWTLCHRAGLA